MTAEQLKDALNYLAPNTNLQVAIPNGDGTYTYYDIDTTVDDTTVDYENNTAALVCSRKRKNPVTSNIKNVAQYIFNQCFGESDKWRNKFSPLTNFKREPIELAEAFINELTLIGIDAVLEDKYYGSASWGFWVYINGKGYYVSIYWQKDIVLYQRLGDFESIIINETDEIV